MLFRDARDSGKPSPGPASIFNFLTFGCFISNLQGEIENVQQRCARPN
jgi:hypothetical protein